MPQTLALSTTQELRDNLVEAAFNEEAMRDGLTYVGRTSFPAASTLEGCTAAEMFVVALVAV